MAISITCTICSREKRSGDWTFLPAYQRYIGDHIAVTRRIAQEESLPFFILSGVFGLIEESREIPWYEHLLTREDPYWDDLRMLVASQLKQHEIGRVNLYVKQKPTWEVYEQLLRDAAQPLGVSVHTVYIENNP